MDRNRAQGVGRGRADQLGKGIDRQILAGIRCKRCGTLRIGDEERCEGCDHWFDPRSSRRRGRSDDASKPRVVGNGRREDDDIKRALLAVLGVLLAPVALWLLDQNGGTVWLGQVFSGLLERWPR